MEPLNIKLARLISEHKSVRQIAKEIGKSPTTTRYWLDRFKLKTEYLSIAQMSPTGYSCPCGETDKSRFYGNKKRICGKCQNQYTVEVARRNKRQAVAYLGGKCRHCGFDGHNSAFDYHHIDPNEKDINFKSSRQWSWERLKQELDKCVLLCANCHRGVHSGDIQLKLP